MKFDVSRFKKVSSDDKCTVLKDPDGHEFKIAHHALTPELKKQINQIPQHFEEGGEVAAPLPEDDNQAPAKEISTAEKIKEARDKLFSGDWLKGGQLMPQGYESKFPQLPAESPEGPVPASIEPPQPQVVEPQAQPVQQNPLIVPPQQMGNDISVMNSLGKQRQGLQMEAQALGEEGKREVDVYAQEQASLEKLQADYQAKFDGLMNERNAIVKEIETQKINPNNYMESMSGGQRARTVIGLLLSGFGAGLSGQENLALKMLNHSIERDIDAQKAMLGKKQSLLQYNMQQLGNLKDATDVTRATMLGVNASRLKQAAAVSKDPLAKARALQAAGKLEIEAAPLIEKAAQRQALLSGVKSGTANPAMAINVLVPKDQQSAAFKELGEYNAIQSAMGQVDQALDSAFKSTTLGENVSSPLQSKQKREQAIGELFPIVKAIVGEKMTDADVQNMVKPFLPGFTTNKQTAEESKVKLKQKLLGMVKGRTPILSSYGLLQDPGKVNFKPLGK